MDRRIVVGDIETGGLTLGRDEILEIGFLLVKLTRTDKVWSYVVEDKLHTLLRPNNPNRVMDSALKVNRLDMEVLSKAPNYFEVKRHIKDWVEEFDVYKMEVLGHNYGGFDKGFLELFLGSYYNIMFDYNDENTYAIAKALQTVGVIPKEIGCHLENLSEYFEIIHKSHTAIDDCYATLQVYVAMLNILEKLNA